MKKGQFMLITSVYLLLMKDGKVLLQKRKDTGFRDRQWGLISGHHDGGETLVQSMIREAKEEANIDIVESDLEFVHLLHKAEKDERLEVFFRTEKFKGQPIIAEPDKADAIGWFEMDGLRWMV